MLNQKKLDALIVGACRRFDCASSDGSTFQRPSPEGLFPKLVSTLTGGLELTVSSRVEVTFKN